MIFIVIAVAAKILDHKYNLRFLHRFPEDLLLFKILQNKIIPGMVQGLVQSKGLQRCACSAGEMRSVILKIQKQTEDFLSLIRQTVSLKEFFRVFSGKAEYDFKVERSFFPFYYGKAERLYISP